MQPPRLVELLCCLILVSVMLMPLAGSGSATAQEEANVNFRWAFGAFVGGENPPRLIAITQDTTLKTGDQLKMLVELRKSCFVYVIHHGPQGEVHWLFPLSTQQLETDYQTAKRYDIPPGDALFKLDEQVGRETFYLLASAERLTGLETLLSTYATASQSEQSQIATNIVSEIREVKKRYRQFATLAERPVPIAGNTRGEDIGDLAVEITAQNFYSKTFTIEHR
jgi:Domain of unknown function (DUF4384)